MKVIMTSKQVL